MPANFIPIKNKKFNNKNILHNNIKKIEKNSYISEKFYIEK